MRASALLALATAFALSGCEEAREAPPAPVAIEPRAIDLAVQPESVVAFELAAPNEAQRARFTGGAIRGAVRFDLDDPERSTGRVTIDLTTLEIEHRFFLPDREQEWHVSPAQQEHARSWLDIDPKQKGARVEYQSALLTLLGLEVEDSSLGPDGPTWHVVLDVELTLHGHKSKGRVPGDVRRRTTSAGLRFAFDTTAPLEVDRFAHDIEPRYVPTGPVGKPWSSRAWVGEVARVSAQLQLAPAPTETSP